MKHFKNITSFDDLKNQYRKLALTNHPDKGGNTATMQEINIEYDILFPIWKGKSEIATTETAQSTRNEFYTAWGWKGENYNSNLRMTDIAKIIREYVKEKYPTYKFSITCDYNSIHIALMEAPQNIFISTNLNEYEKKGLYIQINRFHIEKETRIIELGREIMQDIRDFTQTYNFDDSDSQQDYSHTNFYLYLAIGKWDKPFKIVEKTARIKPERTTNPNEQPEQQSIPENLNIQIIDYSEKAIVLIGTTKALKEKLAEIGGKYNSHLKCGAGWVFSKRQRETVENLLKKLNIKTENHRTPETIELNRKLEIAKIDSDYKFKVSETQTAHINHGYCFYVEGKGYLAFEKDETPYTPTGGIDALQSILHDGGFLHYEDMKFVNPIDERGVQRINYYKFKRNNGEA